MNTFGDYSGYLNLLKQKTYKYQIKQNIDELKNDINILLCPILYSCIHYFLILNKI